jgi:hypothetical protein
MALYRVFGLTLESDYPFAFALAPGSGTPDVTFSCVDAPPLALDEGARTLLYGSATRDDAGESLLCVYHTAQGDVLRWTGVADYCLLGQHIVCRRKSEAAEVVSTQLFAAVLAYWLEQAGTPALHASAVALDEGRGAVGFLSGSGNGKSALAAALLQAGQSLLSDDILAMTPGAAGFLAQPGLATMRMWPDEATFFLGHYADLPRVHPAMEKRHLPVGAGQWGAYCAEPRPLACLFVPERRPPDDPRREVWLSPVSPREALLELVRHSYVARLAQGAGLQPRRLGLLAEVARRVPLWRLSYPSGFDELARVAAVLLEHIAPPPAS